MYQSFLFDGGEAGFEKNLNNSISIMHVLEQAVKKSNFNRTI